VDDIVFLYNMGGTAVAGAEGRALVKIVMMIVGGGLVEFRIYNCTARMHIHAGHGCDHKNIKR
jgi:hypothetical protein